MPIRRLEKTYTGTTSTIGGDEIAASTIPVKPHIQPGILCPAVAGKLLDGTTNHSGAYGTAQSDGKSYYYTDIKGSKPIKDPRIGAHFGSQRHKFKSLQLLEQETATEGQNVYSVDGREWIRARGDSISIENNPYGNNIKFAKTTTDTNFIEVVGYFNDANHIRVTDTDQDFMRVAINGGTVQSTDYAVSTGTPLGSRYIDSGSLFNFTFNATPTLGINTLKILNTTGDQLSIQGIELIAQDKFTDATCDYNNDPTITHDANTRIVAGMSVSGTGIPVGSTVSSVTSTTVFELSASTTGGAVTNGTLTFGTNNISIPSQNVVSYGKKFTVSGIPHYNPFAFKTDGTTAWASGAHNGTSWPVGTGSSANIDTATSLGLANWLHSSNYYKPYNGGRVVVWVASDGTIKTSVNVMPPNARSVGNSASLTNATAKANASIANNTFYPTMEAGAIDHSQAEVAKTFHWREFGNGAANAGTGATYADASMLTGTADDIAYVMDDGLTSLTARNWRGSSTHEALMGPTSSTNCRVFFTFIGTGISWKAKSVTHGGVDEYRWFVDGIEVKVYDGSGTTSEFETPAQNLPYGTHIVQVNAVAASDTADQAIKELTIHQPKMPPIPEDAVVLADYMLMADFVPQPADSSFAHGDVSKGVRYLSGSRDIKYDQTSNLTSGAGWPNTIALDVGYPQGMIVQSLGTGISAGSANLEIPYFGTDVCMTGYTGRLGSTWTESINSTTISNTVRNNSRESRVNTTGQTLQVNGFKTTWTSSEMFISSFEIASPIHTSSHYQSFETPFLHELVGGDRNMEQTNLVVTSDGKTWDQVTRKVDYIGDAVMQLSLDGGGSGYNIALLFDEIRGFAGNQGDKRINTFNKDFAIGYDRQICLVDGEYSFYVASRIRESGASGKIRLRVNGEIITEADTDDGTWNYASISAIIHLKRGDYIQVYGGYWEPDWTINNDYYVRRLK